LAQTESIEDAVPNENAVPAPADDIEEAKPIENTDEVEDKDLVDVEPQELRTSDIEDESSKAIETEHDKTSPEEESTSYVTDPTTETTALEEVKINSEALESAAAGNVDDQIKSSTVAEHQTVSDISPEENDGIEMYDEIAAKDEILPNEDPTDLPVEERLPITGEALPENIKSESEEDVANEANVEAPTEPENETAADRTPMEDDIKRDEGPVVEAEKSILEDDVVNESQLHAEPGKFIVDYGLNS
jgi:hypothetical protein